MASIPSAPPFPLGGPPIPVFNRRSSAAIRQRGDIVPGAASMPMGPLPRLTSVSGVWLAGPEPNIPLTEEFYKVFLPPIRNIFDNTPAIDNNSDLIERKDRELYELLHSIDDNDPERHAFDFVYLTKFLRERIGIFKRKSFTKGHELDNGFDINDVNRDNFRTIVDFYTNGENKHKNYGYNNIYKFLKNISHHINTRLYKVWFLIILYMNKKYKNDRLIHGTIDSLTIKLLHVNNQPYMDGLVAMGGGKRKTQKRNKKNKTRSKSKNKKNKTRK